MHHANIKTAFRYKFTSSLGSMLIFYLVMVVVMAGAVIGALRVSPLNFSVGIGTSTEGHFSGYGMAAMIFLFVIGIVSIREDLRLFMQHGIGRRSLFITEILMIPTLSLMLAIGGELLVTIGRALTIPRSTIIISDLYQQIFMADSQKAGMDMMAHLESVLLFFALFVFTYASGMFISLIFYRLNKMWTIVVAIGVPLFLIFGLPALIITFKLDLIKPIEVLLSSFWLYFAFIMAFSVLINLFNWLMLRRAPVKAAKPG